MLKVCLNLIWRYIYFFYFFPIVSERHWPDYDLSALSVLSLRDVFRALPSTLVSQTAFVWVPVIITARRQKLDLALFILASNR